MEVQQQGEQERDDPRREQQMNRNPTLTTRWAKARITRAIAWGQWWECNKLQSTKLVNRQHVRLQAQNQTQQNYEQEHDEHKWKSREKCFPKVHEPPIAVVAAPVSILPLSAIRSFLRPLAIPKFQLLVQTSSAKPLSTTHWHEASLLNAHTVIDPHYTNSNIGATKLILAMRLVSLLAWQRIAPKENGRRQMKVA